MSGVNIALGTLVVLLAVCRSQSSSGLDGAVHSMNLSNPTLYKAELSIHACACLLSCGNRSQRYVSLTARIIYLLIALLLQAHLLGNL